MFDDGTGWAGRRRPNAVRRRHRLGRAAAAQRGSNRIRIGGPGATAGCDKRSDADVVTEQRTKGAAA